MSCLYRVYTSRRSILFLSLTCNQFSPIERLLFLDLEVCQFNSNPMKIVEILEAV